MKSQLTKSQIHCKEENYFLYFWDSLEFLIPTVAMLLKL